MVDSHTRRRPPRDLMSAVRDAVQDFGVDELASRTGASPGTIYNKINTSDTSHHIPTLADAVVWPQVMGDYRIPQAYCRALGGIFVGLHAHAQTSDMELLNLVLKRDVEQGQFADALATALSDGSVSPKDFDMLKREGWDVITAWLELLSRLEGMVNG